MKLNLFPDLFAICKLCPTAECEKWQGAGNLYSMIQDAHGWTVICPESFTTDPVRSSKVLEKTLWRCFQIDGVLDFDLVGIIAGLSGLLANAEIPVFVVCSFETDYLMVARDNVEKAAQAFSDAGHIIATA